MACAIPPRFDPTSLPRSTRRRACGPRTTAPSPSVASPSVGRAIDADTVPAALAVLARSGPTARRGRTSRCPARTPSPSCHDIRTYYEEAGLELVDGPPPGGRAAEAWFFEETEAGRTVMAARGALKDQDAPFPFWFYMAPAHR